MKGATHISAQRFMWPCREKKIRALQLIVRNVLPAVFIIQLFQTLSLAGLVTSRAPSLPSYNPAGPQLRGLSHNLVHSSGLKDFDP